MSFWSKVLYVLCASADFLIFYLGMFLAGIASTAGDLFVFLWRLLRRVASVFVVFLSTAALCICMAPHFFQTYLPEVSYRLFFVYDMRVLGLLMLMVVIESGLMWSSAVPGMGSSGDIRIFRNMFQRLRARHGHG